MFALLCLDVAFVLVAGIYLIKIACNKKLDKATKLACFFCGSLTILGAVASMKCII